MFVVTNEQNQILVGPEGWSRRVAAAVGLAGNASPPSRPFSHDGKTLRDVVFTDKLAYQTEDSGSVVGDAWHVPAVDLSLDDAKTAARDALAARRYQAETGGITVNAMPIATDRHTQSVLTSARILAKENANYTVNWKTTAGFVTLDATSIISIADAVAAHVQACFDNEKAISEQIDAAADVDALRAIDLEGGW